MARCSANGATHCSLPVYTCCRLLNDPSENPLRCWLLVGFLINAWGALCALPIHDLPCHSNTDKDRSAQELLTLAPAANSDFSAHRNINKLSKEPTVLEQLANSLAPSIYGHETIKKGLVSWLHEASTSMHA